MDTDRLKSTWAEVARHGDDVPSYFYAHLFVTNPELRALFPLVMSAQRDRLVGALGRIVSSVDDLGSVVPFVQQLGRDHRRFSVVAEHYDAVGASLLWTLSHFLGDRWTPEVAADWAAAYGIVASTMVDAAERGGGRPAGVVGRRGHPTRRGSAARSRCSRSAPASRSPTSPGQSMAMSIPQVPRSWRFYTPANAPREDGTIDLHVAVLAGGTVSGPFVPRCDPVTSSGSARRSAPASCSTPTTTPTCSSSPGNTGLAPFLALLDDIGAHRERGWPMRQVHVVHGVRFPWNLYAGPAAPGPVRARLARATPRSSATTPPTRDVGASSVTWRPSCTFDGRYHAMICGSPAMVHHSHPALLATPKPPETVQVEEYAAMPSRPSTTPNRKQRKEARCERHPAAGRGG